MKKLFCLFLFSLVLQIQHLPGFDNIVIWGHKLHSHTHSYIHQGFYNAFKHLGYQTYWLDNQDNIENIDLSNSLFITEGQVDRGIPLRSDCCYLVHNPSNASKYKPFNSAFLQVYNDDVLREPTAIKIATCIYYDLKGKCLYFPWATNLFPNEIDEVKEKLNEIQKDNAIYWVGTVGDGYFGNRSEINPFIRACEENNVVFKPMNPCGTGISDRIHLEMIMKSYMAPAIVGEWQKSKGYIPCRIFKNISYGQIGITNSLRVNELFEGKLVYNPDTYQLFYDAEERLRNLDMSEVLELMDLVKEKHTYINRALTILEFLSLLGYN